MPTLDKAKSIFAGMSVSKNPYRAAMGTFGLDIVVPWRRAADATHTKVADKLGFSPPYNVTLPAIADILITLFSAEVGSATRHSNEVAEEIAAMLLLHALVQHFDCLDKSLVEPLTHKLQKAGYIKGQVKVGSL